MDAGSEPIASSGAAPDPTPTPNPADLLRRLRAYSEGVLILPDEEVRSIRYVVCRRTGMPMASVPAIVLEAAHATLCIPDDGFDHAERLQLVGQAVEVDALRDEGADRLLAYFGKPAHTHIARLEASSLQRLDQVIGAELVALESPLRSAEASLCKLANAQPARVARAVERATGTLPETPLVVGVDPWGLDVRARFGVLRVEFAQLVSTPDEARAALAALLEG